MSFLSRTNRLSFVVRTKKRLKPVVDLDQIVSGFQEHARYRRDWRAYAAMPGSEPLTDQDALPCLFDRTATHPLDTHYFYQDIWAFKAVQASGVKRHIDVGSRAILVGMLTTITHVVFIDIRPLDIMLENYESRPGSVLALPLTTDSVNSLSCLHVAEHIGLGRYGDTLDPLGTQKAIVELSRVLAPGGNLYFSVPVGRPRVCFNAHRIHSPQQILDYFYDLDLLSFSGTDDRGRYLEDITPGELAKSEYACGLFHFTKRVTPGRNKPPTANK